MIIVFYKIDKSIISYLKSTKNIIISLSYVMAYNLL